MIFENMKCFLEKLGCFVSSQYIESYPRNINCEKFVLTEMRPVFNYIVSLFALVFIGLMCILSIASDVSNFICGTSMFQRSGALLVAAFLYVEYSFIKCDCSDKTDILNDHLWGSDNSRLEFLYSYSSMIGFIGVVVGTVIWAYGDFLVSAPCCKQV